jgi:hypothetical protein
MSTVERIFGERELTPYANELEALMYDCGGPSPVAEALGVSRVSVWSWIERGHLPWTELDGRTQYSERIAGMQRRGRLSPVEIRRIGLRV